MNKLTVLGSIIVAAIATAAIKLVPFEDVALHLRSQESVANQIGEELQTYPPLKALHDHYPEEYAQIAEAAAKGIKAGYSPAEVMRSIRPQIWAAYHSKMEQTSDELLGKQLDFALRQLRYLRGQNPQYCYEIVATPAQLSFDLGAVMPRFMIEEEAGLMAEVIAESSRTSPSSPIPVDEELLAALTEKALESLSVGELEALSRADFDPSRVRGPARASMECNFRINFLTELKALPLSDKANLFRSLT